MNYNFCAGLGFQHIKYFIAIAELGTMNRAAAELNVTQPLLSQKLTQLEKMIGIQLFQREKQRLRLTPSGELLLQEWRNIMQMFDTSIERAFELHSSNNLPIIFGWSNGIEHKTIRPCIHALQRTFPDIQITWRFIDIFHLLENLIEGYIDLAAIPDFGQLRSEPDIEYLEVIKLSLCLIHSRDHPLAQKKQVDWADIRPYRIILPELKNNENFTDELMRNCRKKGFLPHITYYEEETLTLQFEIMRNGGITFLLSHGLESDDFMERELESDVPHSLVLAWRKDASEKVTEYARSAAPEIAEVYKWRRNLLSRLRDYK